MKNTAEDIAQLKQTVEKHEKMFLMFMEFVNKINSVNLSDAAKTTLDNVDIPVEKNIVQKPIVKDDDGEDWDDCDDEPSAKKKTTPSKKVDSKSNDELNPVDLIGECASDDELDGTYGDPKVFVEPKDWKGPSFKDKKYSECPIEYLLKLAKLMDWIASENKKRNAMANNGKPKHVYNEIDAKRARGWAKRKMNSGTVETVDVPEENKINPDGYSF